MNHKEDTKFKANPYNFNNVLISEQQVTNIMNSLNITDFQLTNLDFYKTAFIHKSYCKLKDYEEYDYPGKGCVPLQDISYETMEFLGDAILGSVVSSYLYERFYKIHKQNEGFLTKLKIRIICGENLCKLSKHLSFQKYLVISKHIEDNCEGRKNSNILEDVLEAFIGAIYLDTDYPTAEKFIIQVIESFVDFTEVLLIDNNYKDQISRYFQRNFNDGSRPIYKHTKENDTFYCELYHKDKLLIQGEGVSKKKSEQDVSKKALIYFNVIT
tara:strand:- start:2036 stop:2845 length:810 start_codon:yes stop_codon:yes gene_type:complete